MRANNEEGNSSLIILLVIIIIILVSLVAWLGYKVNHKTTQDKSLAAKSNVNNVVHSSPAKVVQKTYCDTLHVGCLTYPSNWSVNVGTVNNNPVIQIGSPLPSHNIVGVSYRLNAKTPGTSANDQAIDKLNFNTPINGVSIEEAITADINSPYIVAVDSSSKWNQTKGVNNWTLEALPSEQSFTSASQARDWFSTPEAKTALQIIQSFKYQ